MKYDYAVFIVLLPLLILTGCSNHVALKGKVVYSDDKSPVPVGMVFLETDTYGARGELKPDGTFIVGALKAKDGLPPGKYRVYISGAEAVSGYTPSGDEIFAPLITKKFTDPDTSGITIDVTRSTKEFVIVVDRFQKKKQSPGEQE